VKLEATVTVTDNDQDRDVRTVVLRFAAAVSWRQSLPPGPQGTSLHTLRRKVSKYKEEPEVGNGTDWVLQEPAKPETALLDAVK